MALAQITTFEQLISYIEEKLADNNSAAIDPSELRTSLLSLIGIQSLKNDLLLANLTPNQTVIWNNLIAKLEQIQQDAKSGTTGNAKQSNGPLNLSPYESYKVIEPITTAAAWYTAADTTNKANFPILQADLDANNIYFEVNNGVVSVFKSLKPVTSPAKLPLYSAIKTASIVATTQFVDDENGNIIYRILTGQTLNIGELPANFPLKAQNLGLLINKVYDEFRVNLFDVSKVVSGYHYNNVGILTAGTGSSASPIISVLPSKKYTFVNKYVAIAGSGNDQNLNFNVVFFDINGAFISKTFSEYNVVTLTTPANCYVIAWTVNFLGVGTNASDLMLIKGINIPLKYYGFNDLITSEIYSNQKDISNFNNLQPAINNLEKNAVLDWTPNSTTGTLNTNNWIQDFAIPANKRIKTVEFTFGTTNPMFITFWEKVGTDFTIRYSQYVTPVIGLNIITINKTFTTDIRIGVNNALGMAYAAVTGSSIVSVGNGSFSNGTTKTPVSTLALLMKIKTTYVDSAYDLTKIEQIKTPILPYSNAFRYLFSTAISSDFTSANFTYDATLKSAVSSTANAFMILNKNFKSNKRKHRTNVVLYSDSVFHFGSSDLTTSVSYAARGSVVKLDYPNLKLQILNINTLAVLSEVSIAGIQTGEHFLEIEKNQLNITVNLVRFNNLQKFTTSFTNSETDSQSGNLTDYPSIKLLSGTIEIKAFDVFLIYKPLIVFVGDSISELGYRGQTFASILLEKNFNGDGALIAKGGANSDTLALNFEEIAKIQPKYLSMSVGTNNGISLSQIDQWINLCATNNIKLIMNRISSTQSDVTYPFLISNSNIRAKGVYGANMDYTTALNNDPTQNYNSTLFLDGVHPNSLGHAKMVERFLSDIKII